MRCSLFDICHRDDDIQDLAEGLCILHARVDKSTTAFTTALEAYRKGSSDFRYFVFPTARFSGERFDGPVNFARATFPRDTNFVGTHFTEGVDFTGARFMGSAEFQDAKFDRMATFSYSHFAGRASFEGAVFHAEAILTGIAFAGPLTFLKARFTLLASFGGTDFSGDVEFQDVTFGTETSFCFVIFRGQAIFRGNPEALIFQKSVVDFRNVTSVGGAIHFRHADLRLCELNGTDCRSIEFTNVRWPIYGRRTAVFDEIVLQRGRAAVIDALRLRRMAADRPHWAEVERLYRELKQSHEERRDYERAGDFHYGEKEMRRRNLDTSAGLRAILYLYWLLSGYGERVLRPLGWTIGLLLYCAVVYIWAGLSPAGSDTTLTASNFSEAFRYSFEVMFLLKPDDLSPQTPVSQWLRAIESVLGPVFIGLFALALRQRLKR